MNTSLTSPKPFRLYPPKKFVPEAYTAVTRLIVSTLIKQHDQQHAWTQLRLALEQIWTDAADGYAIHIVSLVELAIQVMLPQDVLSTMLTTWTNSSAAITPQAGLRNGCTHMDPCDLMHILDLVHEFSCRAVERALERSLERALDSGSNPGLDGSANLACSLTNPCLDVLCLWHLLLFYDLMLDQELSQTLQNLLANDGGYGRRAVLMIQWLERQPWIQQAQQDAHQRTFLPVRLQTTTETTRLADMTKTAKSVPTTVATMTDSDAFGIDMIDRRIFQCIVQ